MWYERILHTNRVPDILLRPVLWWITGRKIRQLNRKAFPEQEKERRELLEKFDSSPIALVPDLPNEQHYEVPPEFFELVLGRRLKYSCCYWPEGVEDLEAAEEAMLELTCRRAGLTNGMKVLDLGCGWGSLTLWIAEKYPECQITAVSNSRDQIQFITNRAEAEGLNNVRARVMDVNQLELDDQFDRVFSIEMFEHMKNYRALMHKIKGLLNDDGRLFVHIFSHRQFAYEYDQEDQNNWMARTFFSGGTMPSDDLLLHFTENLGLVDHWRISGLHYLKTLRAWRRKMESQKQIVRKVLAGAYGSERVDQWWVNWRLFFLACEATWAYRNGREYIVSHYLFQKRK